MKKSFLTAVLAIIVFSTLLFHHCAKITGNRPANRPPEIAFANIPPDSTTVTSKPTVYWFGKDVDGYVAEYQYVVATTSQIAALGLTVDGFKDILHGFGGFNWVASCSLWADSLEKLGQERINGITLVTERGRGQTSSQIQLFASPDSTVFIKQYIFLRAVDNLGLQSNETPYRLFSRNNHAPNTKIDGFNEKEVHYSLPETTATWKGINIFWSGSDSSDYPRAQPELEYYLELFGPFPDTIGVRNNPDPNKLLADTGWVTWTGVVIGGLQTGYHLFRVRSRDDALIPDPTPATAMFLVIRPPFTNNVLALDVTKYTPAPFGYELDSVKVRNFYQNIFANASPSFPISNAEFIRVPPRESLLSQYKMILLINHDVTDVTTPSETTCAQLAKYLSVGGKLWLLGMNNFNVRASFPAVKDLERLYRSDPKWSYFLGFTYCGVKEVYQSHWEAVGDSTNCPPLSPACQEEPHTETWFESRNEEFIGADPLIGGLSTLEVDTVKIKSLTSNKSGVSLIFTNKLPGVDYNTISIGSPPAEALYLFKSYRGGASPLDGKPCAVRFLGPLYQGAPIYKTSEFTFPLYYIIESQATTLTGLMLQWFDLTTPLTTAVGSPSNIRISKGGD